MPMTDNEIEKIIRDRLTAAMAAVREMLEKIKEDDLFSIENMDEYPDWVFPPELEDQFHFDGEVEFNIWRHDGNVVYQHSPIDGEGTWIESEDVEDVVRYVLSALKPSDYDSSDEQG